MAVRHGYGKIAGADALVFAYDTGDTRNSYKGEPTENVVNDPTPSSAWGISNYNSTSTRSYGVDEDGNPMLIIDVTSVGSGYPRSTGPFLLSTITGTFSTSFEAKAATNGINIALKIYENGSTKVSNTANLTTEWQRFTFDNQSTGFTLDRPYFNPVNNGTYYIRKIQIEAKSHSTPYVNGTRSVSGSLFDLTGNSSVDLSNVSFDSNADIDLDGTDDYIETADSSLLDLTTDMSFEFVVNADSSQGNLYPRLIDKSIYLIHITQTSPFTIAQNITTSGGLRQTALGSAFTAGEYTHIVTTYDGRYGQIFVNGDLKYTRDFSTELACNTNSTSVRIGGDGSTNRPLNGQLPISKIYNRVLSAAEVQSNYRHYKNRFGI